jgi:hypothetical protein
MIRGVDVESNWFSKVREDLHAQRSGSKSGFCGTLDVR